MVIEDWTLQIAVLTNNPIVFLSKYGVDRDGSDKKKMDLIIQSVCNYMKRQNNWDKLNP